MVSHNNSVRRGYKFIHEQKNVYITHYTNQELVEIYSSVANVLPTGKA